MIPTPPPVAKEIPASKINTDAIATSGKFVLDKNIQPENIKA